MKDFLDKLGGGLMRLFDEAGQTLALLFETLLDCRQAPKRFRPVMVQMLRVGPGSLPIASLMAVFTGMVLAMHSGYALRSYSSEEMLATIVALSMVKEMAPVLTGMLVAGRMGAAFAAEIGAMRVNEEIDALETLGISPIRYLCMPRLVACVVMTPALVIYAELVGILGGLSVASGYFDIPARLYFQRVYESIQVQDLTEGIVKAVVFGTLVAIIACRRGLNTTGGARGVGDAITHCVVQCFVAIFISNYFVSSFFATR